VCVYRTEPEYSCDEDESVETGTKSPDLHNMSDESTAYLDYFHLPFTYIVIAFR